MIIERDGSFEIILGATRPEGATNWMELKSGASRFILRNGFYDWDNEVEASVRVEVIAGPVSGPVPHMTVEEFQSDIGPPSQEPLHRRQQKAEPDGPVR